MTCFNWIRARLVGSTAAIGVWASTAPALAQESGGITAGKWAPSYFFILLFVVLGIMVVGRSARRRERAKPEDYQAKLS